MVSPECPPEQALTPAPASPGRWFIGIGVGEYDDPELKLENAVGDVGRMATWFTQDSRVDHRVALENLTVNPKWAEISADLRNFLNERSPEDVVVIYIACHGEQEADEAYLFGRDTPRANLAGCAVAASQLGRMLGTSKPHNVLVIVDACVAGSIAAFIADGTRKAVREQNTRDPYRRYAQVMIASTFGLDPAQDGEFVDAFLRTVRNERWTGTVRPWISLEQLVEGLNEELREAAPGQQVECSPWFNGEIQLIPNPNVGCRQSGPFDNEDFAAHFDPASRGVSRREAGAFFTGRTAELERATGWLNLPQSAEAKSMFVITGSPGTGKSALLSRIAVLSQPDLLPDGTDLAALPPETVPAVGAFAGVVWSHGKTRRQVIGQLARILEGTASTPETLIGLAQAHGEGKVIAIDALDESAPGEAHMIAREVLAPLAAKSPVRLMIGTRRQAVGGGGPSLLDALAMPGGEMLDLDLVANQRTDMIDYVEARLRARGLASSPASEADVARLARAIASAADRSFLVASIAARTAKVPKDWNRPFRLPEQVGEAFGGYLDGLPHPGRVRDVLRPLAWALGSGLPWGTVWSAMATALVDGASAVDDAAIGASLDVAADLVVESNQTGEPVYRLFHEALAEHLRATTPGRGEAPARLSRALLALRKGRTWREAPRYVRGHLPTFLAQGKLLDEMGDVLLDPAWARQRRIDTGDPLAIEHDVETAASLFREHRYIQDLAPLCHQHSRAMIVTVPPLIELLALSGQHRRAEALAANLTDVADRMLAFRALAQIYASDRNLEAARRCAEEVELTLPGMHNDHRPMAWCWAAQAATAAGLSDVARRCAARSLDAIEGNDEWDRENGLFWAAVACRAAEDHNGLTLIRAALEVIVNTSPTFRNQFLQAASVAGFTDFLKVQVAERVTLPAERHSSVRIGNLALAVADAGLADEMATLVAHVGRSTPDGEPDSLKRWAWALALSGRHVQAVAALPSIHDHVECSKAIARIAGIIAAGGDGALIDQLKGHVDQLLPSDEPRTEARLTLARWSLGQREIALGGAERAMAESGRFSATIDPRAEERSQPTGIRNEGRKTARRAMVTSRAPVVDRNKAADAELAARNGDLGGARAIVGIIDVPQFKADALSAIARHDPDEEAAIGAWMEALVVGRRAGRGAVERVLEVGIELLHKFGRRDDALALRRRVDDVDAAWELELFVDEYAFLRASMPSGSQRTAMLEGLMLAPMELAVTRAYTTAEVEAAWRRGEDGSRLFALGLMRGDPGLAVTEFLVEGIRASRSAFEQFHALCAVPPAQWGFALPPGVVRAVEDEMHDVPRADGSPARIKESTHRIRVAQRLLERHYRGS